ncbi:LysM peptidoglycan-binding domain-containing protein [Flavobacterium procerum]|uniref:LysM peptidoglycan-binding domain-containing protein n=1 Tax=Flavobacterium procerum TaxID=1455569 RepID=A0ABV6BPS8_9FLAO
MIRNIIRSKQLFFVLLAHFLNISSTTGQTVNTNSKILFSTHEVKPKETIYSISNMYNLSTGELIELNPELKNEGIQLGMSLKVPVVNAEGANQVKKGTDVSNSVNSQNQKSQSSFVGEINPSISINSSKDGADKKRIIDFSDNYMLLLGREFAENKTREGQTYKTKENFFSIVDFNFKQFNKISSKQKLQPLALNDENDNYPIYRFDKYNLKMLKIAPLMSNGNSFLFVNYKENLLYTINTQTKGNSVPCTGYWHKSDYYVETENYFLTSSLDLVVEMIQATRNDKKKKIYVVYDKSSKIIKTETKNKDFTIYDCVYSNHNVPPNSKMRRLRYENLNESCAFTPNDICAYARVPQWKYLDGKPSAINPDESIYSAYIDFFKNSNEPSMPIYTYEFKFDKGKVDNAIVSLDMKYILINNKFVYALPSIEISK